MRLHATHELELTPYIIQPSSFWTKSTWEQTGGIDESFTYAFDWDWFVKVKRAGVNMVPVKDYLSLYRIHEAHKSGSSGNKRALELAEVFRKYKGEKVASAYLKLEKYSNEYSLFHKSVYAANHFELGLIGRIIHLLFFRSISFEEYKQIAPR